MEGIRRICETDREQALEWMAIYEIRSIYDALRCKDASAVPQLRELLYAFQAPNCRSAMDNSNDDLKAIALAAFDHPEHLALKSSPWWICTGGLQLTQQVLSHAPDETTFLPETVEESDWVIPESDWPQALEQVKAKFVAMGAPEE